MKGAAVNATTAIADGVSSLFGRQQGQEAGSGERKFEAGHCGSAKAGTSRTEGADKNGEPPQQRDKQDRPELPAKNQGIRQQTGTDRHLFPYREGIVAHSRTMPGSGVYRGTDKAGCQPATRGVQREGSIRRNTRRSSGRSTRRQPWRGTRRRKGNSGCALTACPYSNGSK